MPSSIALYVHWPFCKSKCPYCDFNSHVREQINYEEWCDAYLAELEYFAPQLQGKTIPSIFFGGGTPSLMPPYIAERIIDKLASLAKVDAATEISLEANPTSVEATTFKDFANAGINRFSLGIQSLNDKDLTFLGREHSAGEARQAIESAAQCTDNYSFDLIYARPNQTVAAWREELNEALKLACKHLSLYQLTIEKGTPFFSAYKQKAFDLPNDALSEDLFEATQDIMAAHDMPMYEISNHAKRGFECKHNLVYWHYEPYLGIGAGAHSRLWEDGRYNAMMTWHSPEKWLQSVKEHGHAIQSNDALDEQDMLHELLMMGLRLPEGIKRERFHELFNKEPEVLLNKNALAMLQQERLLVLNEDRLHATESGIKLLNSVLVKLFD